MRTYIRCVHIHLHHDLFEPTTETKREVKKNQNYTRIKTKTEKKNENHSSREAERKKNTIHTAAKV